MRQSTTLQGNQGRAADLVDAALAVGEAPTLTDAFQALAGAGLALVGADHLSVVFCDESGEARVVTAGAAAEALATTVRLSVGPGGDGPVLEAGWRARLDEEETAEAESLLTTLTRISGVAGRARHERDRGRLDSVLDGVADGVLVASGQTLTANAAARAILAVPDDVPFRAGLFNPRTLDGEPYALSPDNLPGAGVVQTGEPMRFKVRATALDGRELVLDGSVSPVGGGTVVVFRDVTDEHARAVLNEQYLYALFNALPIPLTVGPADTHEIIDVNDAFLALTGFSREEIVGSQPPFPWWSPDEDSHAGFDPGSVVHRVYRRKDGRPLPVEVASHGVPDDSGRVALLLGVVNDLSEKRRLDQQLVQSGKLAAIGELAAGVAHEINNPLFAILGLTEFLIKEAEPNSRAYQRLELIQQTGLEIKEIVRALLDFARENAEERHVVALEEVVQSTVDLVRRTNAHKGVELVDGYRAGGACVNASPNQLKQIFLNLIANARQAMPDGGTVHVDVRRTGDHVLAVVTDDGPGIEPDVLERIFEPFFTTKRLTGGTGLGLSVSLGIAEAHGGTLTAASEPGRGASFTLCLPVVDEEQVA